MWKYTMQKYDTKTMARAVGNYLPISMKKSREIGRFIKGKKAETAIKMLEEVIEKKRAVPMKRYNRDTAHRVGMAAGKYPVKDSAYIIKLIKSAIKNAEEKGLVSDALVIDHFSVSRAVSKESRRGRLLHVEVGLKEKIDEKGDKNEKNKRSKGTK